MLAERFRPERCSCFSLEGPKRSMVVYFQTFKRVVWFAGYLFYASHIQPQLSPSFRLQRQLPFTRHLIYAAVLLSLTWSLSCLCPSLFELPSRPLEASSLDSKLKAKRLLLSGNTMLYRSAIQTYRFSRTSVSSCSCDPSPS